MKKFRIDAVKKFTTTFEVEADSLHEARKLAWNVVERSDHTWVFSEYHTVPLEMKDSDIA